MHWFTLIGDSLYDYDWKSMIVSWCLPIDIVMITNTKPSFLYSHIFSSQLMLDLYISKINDKIVWTNHIVHFHKLCVSVYVCVCECEIKPIIEVFAYSFETWYQFQVSICSTLQRIDMQWRQSTWLRSMNASLSYSYDVRFDVPNNRCPIISWSNECRRSLSKVLYGDDDDGRQIGTGKVYKPYKYMHQQSKDLQCAN